jgi:hypothetical protein
MASFGGPDAANDLFCFQTLDLQFNGSLGQLQNSDNLLGRYLRSLFHESQDFSRLFPDIPTEVSTELSTEVPPCSLSA